MSHSLLIISTQIDEIILSEVSNVLQIFFQCCNLFPSIFFKNQNINQNIDDWKDWNKKTNEILSRIMVDWKK